MSGHSTRRPRGSLLTTTILLLSSLTAAAPLPAPSAIAHSQQQTTQQCRCAIMPTGTPFYPSMRASSPAAVAAAAPQDIVTDACAALGPQLQAWREAPAEHAAEQAAQLEAWLVDKEAKVAQAASEALWGKRPLPTAAALANARTQHSGGRPAENARPTGRVVCRSVEVAEEENASAEDALYAETTAADRLRKTEALQSPDGKEEDGCSKKGQKTSFMDEVIDAWKRPERHMFALKLVVFVLIMLCMIELGEDIFIWLRRRRSHRGMIRISGDEKSWYKPGLEPIVEEEEEEA